MKQILKKMVMVIVAVAMVFELVATTGVISAEAATKVTKVKLSKTSTSMYVGKSLTLKATVTPTKATNKKVKWTSSNTKVATVTQSGKVVAKKAGTVKIKATAVDGSKKSATCTIKVNTPNSIKSVKVVNEYTVQVTLAKAQKLATSKFVVKNKYYGFATYNRKIKIDYVETKDNKVYNIVLDEPVEEWSYVQVTVSGLTGVSGSKSKDTPYNEKSVDYDKSILSLAYNESYEKENIVSYESVTVSAKNLPTGLKVSTTSNARGYKVSGKPTKKGAFSSTITIVTETGDKHVDEIEFLVADSSTIAAGARDVYGVLNEDGYYQLSNSVYVNGGSGSYKYELQNYRNLLSVSSSGTVSGRLIENGVYDIVVKVTDANNEKLTTEAKMRVKVTKGYVVSGVVKDAAGKAIANQQVEVVNKDNATRYFWSTYVTTDENGKYKVVVPKGKYDFYVFAGNAKKIIQSASVTAKKTVNIKVNAYKVTVKFPEGTTASDFSNIKWKTSSGKEIVTGTTFYLKAGTYNLISEGYFNTVNKYKFKLSNMKVNASKTVTAKGSITEPKVVTLGSFTGTYTYELTFYKFVPTETGTYTFSGTGAGDSYGYLYNSSYSNVASNDDSGDGANFLITYDCTAGEAYYLGVRRYSSSGNPITTTVTIEKK